MFPVSVDQSTSKKCERVLITVSLLFSPQKQISKFSFTLERCEVILDELAKMRFQRQTENVTSAVEPVSSVMSLFQYFVWRLCELCTAPFWMDLKHTAGKFQ